MKLLFFSLFCTSVLIAQPSVEGQNHYGFENEGENWNTNHPDSWSVSDQKARSGNYSLKFSNDIDPGTSAPKPNIIYILADDLGYGELGSYGQTKIKTPNLDEMAREGIRFTDHYSGQTVCSPSRCALMTGKHMGHASVKQNGQLLDPDDLTIAELLKEAGYLTAAIGKWGLAQGPANPNRPNQQGFEHWFGFDNQGFAHFYYPEYLWRNQTKVLYKENLDIRDSLGRYIPGKGTYCHDEFTKEALGFIEENKDSSFFLYLPYAIPHAELTVPEDSREQYEDLGWPETPKAVGGGAKPGNGYGSQYTDGYCAQDQPNLTYAAMVSRMDRDIGSILELLDRLGIAENTVVFFSSDNGPSDEGGQDMDFFESSGGLRGHKRDIYEGGIRIPFIARWKGTIAPGRESNLPSAFWDFLPTACEITGIQAPANVDGISLLPELLGLKDQQKKHEYLYWEWREMQAIRVGKWKMFRMNDTGEYELYDLEQDRSEQNNLADERPDLISKFSPYFEEARAKN